MADDMHMMIGEDGQVTMVDLGPMLARHRAAVVAVRAAAVGEVAAALSEECFDPGTVWDASTLPVTAKDAAAHVAVTLRQIEQQGHA